jgi:hypothetical protein
MLIGEVHGRFQYAGRNFLCPHTGRSSGKILLVTYRSALMMFLGFRFVMAISGLYLFLLAADAQSEIITGTVSVALIYSFV